MQQATRCEPFDVSTNLYGPGRNLFPVSPEKFVALTGYFERRARASKTRPRPVSLNIEDAVITTLLSRPPIKSVICWG